MNSNVCSNLTSSATEATHRQGFFDERMENTDTRQVDDMQCSSHNPEPILIDAYDQHMPDMAPLDSNEQISQPRELRYISIGGPLSRNILGNVPDTPSTRTGPPRTLSFAYSTPNSPVPGPSGIPTGIAHSNSYDHYDEHGFSPSEGEFRGALQFVEGEPVDRKGKRRSSRQAEEGWNINPMKWFSDTPNDRGQPPSGDPGTYESAEPKDAGPSSQTKQHRPRQNSAQSPRSQQKTRLRRAFSVPNAGVSGHGNKWKKIRDLIPSIVPPGQATASAPTGQSAVGPSPVNITDELITGGLSTLMLRLWFEPDEKGHRRVPILFHRLRLRVSDSLKPTNSNKMVFRIECEYANGAARWVVYRELRDFVSLHTHYTVSNVYKRNVEKLPEFPKTSLPYLKFLIKEGKDVGHADFARLQRESLEKYLIELIRAVMFQPSSNRLAAFLEVSALSISLAQSGGAQFKAGYLRIEASGNNGANFGRRSAGWKARREDRWCAIRESYLAVVEDPGEVDVWDVFLLDPEFEIIRPMRYYRRGLHLLHPSDNVPENTDELQVGHHGTLRAQSDTDHRSIVESIRSKVSRIFHVDKEATAETARGESVSSDSDFYTTSHGSTSFSIRPPSPPTPMLDPSTHKNPLAKDGQLGESEKGKVARRGAHPRDVSKHTFYVVNSQVRLKLYAKNERQMQQWITALEKIQDQSPFSKLHRFDSFAPIRMNVAAQWLVDGRDYFWNLSRAILLARETIFIHDWWLSPELQMRRPNKERYRLDRLLERKAREGVKIHVILYQEVSNRTTPTDSNYAKQRLTSLHPNVMVQRSPSHFQTGTFYWAHHEKLCVIDQTIAFMGGLDLSFGRWDTPQHVLTDDVEDAERSEIWPGKDYSNPRMSDFYDLHKPNDDMYDRTKVPRMPWHDVAMQVVGQPARDLARHFVERWNYLLRIKNHTRVMPFLVPPPEFKPGELSKMGLTGTCEMQICRSAGPWSMGTQHTIEHSIQNAYVKAIEISEHFIYIENQFFITSTVVNDVKVENLIGDALVRRIIRAHREKTAWKCCVMIPLLPGFTFPVDHSDASAIRIILECQNRTIARGPHSIFSRLRKEGINPNEYISFFSLRNWAKMRHDVLTTEQVYIHAKICIVDDRLAIIGSANINERSQRGDRDSELAAVIRDTDLIQSTMAGKPFRVGRFAHTLRVRLMREHLGVDVDALEEESLLTHDARVPEFDQEPWNPSTTKINIDIDINEHEQSGKEGVAHQTLEEVVQAARAAKEADKKAGEKVLNKVGIVEGSKAQSTHGPVLEEERKTYTREGDTVSGFASSDVPTLEERTVIHQDQQLPNCALPAVEGDAATGQLHTNGQAPEAEAMNGVVYGVPANTIRQSDDKLPHTRELPDKEDPEEKAAPAARSALRHDLGHKASHKTITTPVAKPEVDPNCFEDPVIGSFWDDIWVASAVHNTEIYRKVFHAVPDDLVTTWKQYKEFIHHHERLKLPPRGSISPEPVARVPSESGDSNYVVVDTVEHGDKSAENVPRKSKDGQESVFHGPHGSTRRASKGAEPFEKWERDEMERLLGELSGHLVLYPTRFLEGEDIANNFLFNADRLLPLPIYD